MLQTEQVYFMSYRVKGSIAIFYEMVKGDMHKSVDWVDEVISGLAEKHQCPTENIQLIRFEEMD